MIFNKGIAAKHGVALSLIIAYLQENEGNMNIPKLKTALNLEQSRALRYVLLHQEKGNIIGMGKANANLTYKKYKIEPSILKIRGEMLERK